MGSFQTFEELACWKEARVLRNFVKDEIIPKIPMIEKYNLISQSGVLQGQLEIILLKDSEGFIFRKIVSFAG